jgi:hypothetical protein
MTTDSGLRFLVLYEGSKRKYLVFRDETWSEAESEDVYDIEGSLKTFQVPTNFASIMGFVGTKSNKATEQIDFVFKIRKMAEKRNTGADCSGAGRQEQLNHLNKILEESGSKTFFTKENYKPAVCPLMELVMRYFQDEKRADLQWFLDPDTAKLVGF